MPRKGEHHGSGSAHASSVRDDPRGSRNERTRHRACPTTVTPTEWPLEGKPVAEIDGRAARRIPTIRRARKNTPPGNGVRAAFFPQQNGHSAVSGSVQAEVLAAERIRARVMPFRTRTAPRASCADGAGCACRPSSRRDVRKSRAAFRSDCSISGTGLVCIGRIGSSAQTGSCLGTPCPVARS